MWWCVVFLAAHCYAIPSQRLMWGSPARALTVSVDFSLDATISLNQTSEDFSTTFLALSDTTAYDFFYPWENNQGRFMDYAINKSQSSSASLGWLALQSSTGITVLGCAKHTILPTADSKFLLGAGFALNDRLCVQNIEVVLPNKTILVNQTACIKENSDLVRLPAHFGTLDRTTQRCYEFTSFNKNTICTLDSDHGTGLLVPHAENYIELGFDSKTIRLALTMQNGNANLRPAWDDQRPYSTPELYLIGALVFFILAWTLLVSSKTSEPAFDDGSLIYFIYSGVLFAWIMLAYQLVERDLLFRAKFVADPTVDHLLDIYGGFALVALLLNTLLCFYFTHNNDTAVQRSTFETLLAMASASVFIGRPTFCEESVAVFLIASTWSAFQIIYLKVATKPLIHLALFVVLYPYTMFVMTEPIVRLVPDIQRNSFVWTQLLLFIPLFLFFGYGLLQKEIR